MIVIYGKRNYIKTSIVDKKLEELGLIEIDNNDVKAIESLRNRIIIHRVKRILIRYQGDNKKDYKTYKKTRKTYIKKSKNNIYE